MLAAAQLYVEHDPVTATGPTFVCPFCGARISGPPGEVFACPYCKSNVVAQGGGSLPAKGPQLPITGTISSMALLYDPEIGIVLVGPSLPEGGRPTIRGYDLYNKRVGWDALAGAPWLTNDGWTLAYGHSVYVVDGKTLYALDLKTGAQRWMAKLAAAPGLIRDGHTRPAIYDFTPPGTPGVVLVVTEDRRLSAFDRDTGAARWVRSYQPLDPYFSDASPLVRRVEQSTSIVAHDRKVAEVIAPDGSVLARIEDAATDSCIKRCDVDGHHAIVQVNGWGSRREAGIVVFDVLAPRPEFHPMHTTTKCNASSIGGRAYVSTDVGQELRTRGDLVIPPPLRGYRFIALKRTDATLLALLWNDDTPPYVRRLVWLDPTTLAERVEGHDLGSIGGDSGDWWSHHVETDGRLVAAVAAPDNDRERCEIRAFDAASGRRLWSTPIGEWQHHEIVAGYVLVRSAGSLMVLRPDTGAPIASYP